MHFSGSDNEWLLSGRGLGTQFINRHPYFYLLLNVFSFIKLLLSICIQIQKLQTLTFAIAEQKEKNRKIGSSIPLAHNSRPKVHNQFADKNNQLRFRQQSPLLTLGALLLHKRLGLILIRRSKSQLFVFICIWHFITSTRFKGGKI